MTVASLRATVAYDKEASAAVIEIYDDIDPCWGLNVRTLSDQLTSFGDVQEITVRMHSRGGNAIEAFAMYTILAMHKARITVDIIGIAASAASVIAMAGDKVKMSETGQIMIHDPWVYTAGNSARLRRDAERLDVLRGPIQRAYKRRVKAQDSQISEWMSAGEGAGTWFDAARSLELGFIDEVYAAPIPQNSISFAGLANVPAEALAAFTPPAPPAPPDEKTAFAEALQALGEDAESSAVLAEVLAGLSDDRPAPESAFLGDADMAYIDALFAEAGHLEESGHGR